MEKQILKTKLKTLTEEFAIKENEFKEIIRNYPSEDLINSDVQFSENDMLIFLEGNLSDEGKGEQEVKLF